MNVTRLRLENFKRFTDLTIDLSSCAGAPKLVLLIGANGSGKSSVFDAFEYLSAQHKGDDALYKGEAYEKFSSYLKKDPAAEMSAACAFGGGFEVRRSNGSSPTTPPTGWDVKSAFYGRSSFRTVPELRATPQSVDVGADPDRPRRFIEFDTRFDADVARITEDLLRDFWGKDFASDAIKARFVEPINDALARVFGNGSATALRLTQMIPALGKRPADIRFRKGQSEVHYDLLSSGEKEVFNILLNLFTRREHFPNAIYFIDELDVHLHTQLQHALIREVVEHWIPDYSQLWTASHSLGFIEYAGDAADAAIIDFDGPRLRPPAGAGAGAEIPRHLRHRCAQGFRVEGLPQPDAGHLREPGRATLQRDPAPRPVVRRRQGQERRRAAEQDERRVPRPDGPRLPRFGRNRGTAPRAAEPLRARVLLPRELRLPSPEPGGGVAARIRQNGISGSAPGAHGGNS